MKNSIFSPTLGRLLWQCIISLISISSLGIPINPSIICLGRKYLKYTRTKQEVQTHLISGNQSHILMQLRPMPIGNYLKIRKIRQLL